VLRDKLVLEQLFTCQALVEFLGKFKAKKDQLDLRVEYAWLKEHMIFLPDFWKKMSLYCKFTSYQIVGLRKSDSDSPNLYLMFNEWDRARTECVKLARAAKAADPSLYVDNFAEKVELAFDKRKSDIVTPLALAAAYVDPAMAYMDPQPEVPDGFNQFVKVVTKYYQGEDDPAATVATAMSNVLAFRECRGPFFGSTLARTYAKDPNPDVFWAAAVNAVGKTGLEVCRFLVNAYAGQGSAERMNKKVKYVRTAQQNRQTHEVTEAYVEIGMGLTDFKTGPPKKTYLQYRQEHMEELRALKLELLAEAAAAAAPIAVAPVAGGAAAVDNEEEEDEEDEEEDDPDDDAAIMNVIEEEIHAEADEMADAE
jgi:hypothetical protein